MDLYNEESSEPQFSSSSETDFRLERLSNILENLRNGIGELNSIFRLFTDIIEKDIDLTENISYECLEILSMCLFECKPSKILKFYSDNTEAKNYDFRDNIYRTMNKIIDCISSQHEQVDYFYTDVINPVDIVNHKQDWLYHNINNKLCEISHLVDSYCCKQITHDDVESEYIFQRSYYVKFIDTDTIVDKLMYPLDLPGQLSSDFALQYSLLAQEEEISFEMNYELGDLAKTGLQNVQISGLAYLAQNNFLDNNKQIEVNIQEVCDYFVDRFWEERNKTDTMELHTIKYVVKYITIFLDSFVNSIPATVQNILPIIKKFYNVINSLTVYELVQYSETLDIFKDLYHIVNNSEDLRDISDNLEFHTLLRETCIILQNEANPSIDNLSSVETIPIRYIDEYEIYRNERTAKQDLIPNDISQNSIEMWKDKFTKYSKIEELVSSLSHNDCILCTEEFEEKEVGVLPVCEHIFCLKCIKTWFSSDGSCET
jgi:hypothetical protein